MTKQRNDSHWPDDGQEITLGSPVSCAPAKRPQRQRLEGRLVSLAPLDSKAHGNAIYAATRVSDSRRPWAYLPTGPFEDRSSFDADLRDKTRSEDPLYYAIVDNMRGQAVGHAAYLRIAPEHCCIEVGWILYVPAFQRTSGATEAMYLMAKYVFEELGYRRYEWKCDALNAPSRKAALRLGFTFEGIFRQHMIVKGRNRDSGWFSILDSEWPAIKSAFESWLPLEL